MKIPITKVVGIFLWGGVSEFEFVRLMD